MILVLFCACPQYFVDQAGKAQGTIVLSRDFPAVRFAVLSDLHYQSPELGVEGSAFEVYLKSDRKLLRESSEILDAVIEKIAKAPLDFILITGDLTKDGERLNHEKVAEKLQVLERSGKRVYVVPGNHDILNFQAFQYAGDDRQAVENIAPEDFERIYYEYGYSEAVAVDSSSLSYVVEPVPGLWLFGLDACRYDENAYGRESVTGGRFKRETVAWVEMMLKRAAAEKKAVIGFMHHAMLEHFSGQAKYIKSAVINNWKKTSQVFAEYGMTLVFTGHFHAQDITRETFSQDRVLFDVATGSLVTYPCPYRMMTLMPSQNLYIRSEFIDSIGSRPSDFRDFSFNYLHQGIENIAYSHMPGRLFGRAEAREFAADISDLIIAHYQGDEDPHDRHLRPHGGASCCLMLMVNDLTRGIEKDLAPPDNDMVIDLRTGLWW